MSKTVNLQLVFPSDFVQRLDGWAKRRLTNKLPYTPNEWFRQTEAGRKFYIDMAHKFLYTRLSNKELAKLINEKMCEDLGIVITPGRPALMQERVQLLMDAFDAAHPIDEVPPVPKVKKPSQEFIKGVGWVTNSQDGE